MHAVVRCPECAGLSRVPADAVGMTVSCPRCDEPFVARPEPEAPAAPPARRPRNPVVAAPAGPPPIPVVHPVRFAEPDPVRHGPTSALIGLALLPLGVPLAWTVARLTTGVEPVFSYALPVAIALGMAGLSMGVAFTEDWPYATKVKGVLMLVLLGYAAAAFLYFVQKDWLEAARRRFGGPEQKWRTFEPEDKSFAVQLPGKAVPDPGAEPIPGWPLRVFRCADPKQRSTDVYVVAYGSPPDAARGLADDAWFAAVKQAVTQAADGAEPAEEPVAHPKPKKVGESYPGREYRFVLPDRITNRTVRVFRAGTRVFYLAAEGVALPPDAPDVRARFFEKFILRD